MKTDSLMKGRQLVSLTAGELVNKFYAAWAEGSIVELFCTVREDIDLCAAMSFGLPMGGRCRGRGQLEGFFRALRDGVIVSRFTISERIERGDVVVVMGGVEGVVKHTGQPFATSFAHVFVLHQGRIARVRAFFDRGAVAQALLAGQRPVRLVTPVLHAA